MVSYNQEPITRIAGRNREIAVFTTEGTNIDKEVVKSFGEEWLKFQHFSDEMINRCGEEYFDLIADDIVNKNSYVLDIGCGTGRWTKYLTSRANFIEAVDPSNSIFAADNLLDNISNVRLSKAGIETIPFNDETFDFVMSVGVLHHTPDPEKAMVDCVKKVKRGGYFYCYLYHNLESKNWFSRALFWAGELVRKMVCRLPMSTKAFVCDILAVIVYLPFILWVRLLILLGFKNTALKMPLGAYHNKSFFIIRNDSLDKFGTKLEHRYSREEVEMMMANAGLKEIKISDGIPYYHAIGKKP
ncbi:MAG: class I SAM-dependent methyltransferase [Chitinophagaceae bacterium]|nr:class I SAM-dependent methyltransferase [Chitinophagaceae bacterium]